MAMKKRRGRPKKSFFFHTVKNIREFFKKNKRAWNKYIDDSYDRGNAFLRSLRKVERRGRPRKYNKKIQAFSQKKKHIFQLFHKKRIFFQEKKLFWKKKIRAFFHLQPKRGRPKKKNKTSSHIVQPKVVTVRKSFSPSFRMFLSVMLSIFILGFSFFIYTYVFVDLPSVFDLTQKKPLQTTRILDRNGRVLYRIYEDENRTLVPLSAVSPHLIQATIAIEDKNFYHHHGFSFTGIARALLANSQEETIQQGGSTITQQLIKNRLLTPERTLQRKMRELLLSLTAEGVYTKDEILEMYLNQVAYGGSTYGVEEASWRYFNKSARDLNLAESALLAGLPAAPSVYSPFGSNPELAFSRQEEVLRRMLEDGYITEQQFEEARKKEISFVEDRIDIEAPHFVMYVKKLLAEKFGEEMLRTGGLEVRTTLDLDVQHEAEKILSEEMIRLAPLKISNGSILVTNPRTGEILAMVGSKNYFDFAHDGQVNVTLRPRQPGSSIKPLTYAIALEKGKTPSTLIDDSPVVYQAAGSPPYAPKNYDGKFHGKVTLRESLGSSYNIPAVKTLAEIGINTLIDTAEEVGITTWKERNRFGLSLTLGGGEVTMFELSQLYSTFANEGNLVQLNPFIEVHTYTGDTLYESTCVFDRSTCFEKPIFKKETAYLMSNILSDNKARTPAFGSQSVLHIPGQQVAVKTGTTNSMRDNWTVGYTSERLVAVWVGNNDNTPMSYVASGITGASPIWNKMIRALLDEDKPHTFTVPDTMVEVLVCKPTGTLVCSGCPVVVKEVFVKGTEPQKACGPTSFLSKEDETQASQANQRDQLGTGVVRVR